MKVSCGSRRFSCFGPLDVSSFGPLDHLRLMWTIPAANQQQQRGEETSLRGRWIFWILTILTIG